MSRRRPLIVTYHAVGAASGDLLTVPVEILAAQVRLLLERGYTGLTFFDAERRRQEGTLPPRSAVVTFDDGFRSILRAAPILNEIGWPATVFVATDFLDSGRFAPIDRAASRLRLPRSEVEPLRWRDLEVLVARGWEVGSHTVTHARLVEISDDRLAYELEASRAAVARHLGRCDTVAYPYGSADSRVAAAAARAGYAAGATVSSAFRLDEPYRRPRLILGTPDTGFRLRVRLSREASWCRRTRTAEAIVRARRSYRRRRRAIRQSRS